MATSPSVMPACEMSPVHTALLSGASRPDIRAPSRTPSQTNARRSAARPSTITPMAAVASRRSEAPIETKNTTSTGGAPSRTAVRSVSPWRTARFSMTKPAATAASSGSNCWVDPTWLNSAHRPMSTSGTSRPM